jgi:replication fork clamp-binding protein CrfC
MRKVLPLFLVAGMAVASARAYTVSFFEAVLVGTTELKAGEYKIEVDGQKAIIRQGKVQTESPVKVEEGETRFATTVVRYVPNADGKPRIQEIRLGGTKTKLLFAM